MNLEFDLHKLHLDELENPAFADTVLEIGDTLLNCHSFMLAARSRVLGACLAQTGFEEGKSRRTMIKDMSADAVKQLLKYIHSDEVDSDSDDENINDLFIGADKYDIPGLTISWSISMWAT